MLKFIVEAGALEGVKRIAAKASEDFFMVFGQRPEITDDVNYEGEAVVFATIGHSDLVKKINEEKRLSICGKRESFQVLHEDKRLYVIGSDKRGSIYGIFHLSELIGVTPFVYIGDDTPVKREAFDLSSIEEFVSKEPSVKYRGFFINDEWPCFGSWTFEHFGGFTAQMYDHIFELLLRMKGNCLWPAMWSSSFALDGPGELNEELADIYGVIIDYSHHEPCLRASEEWDIYKGQDYGTEWNFSTNKEGLCKYWKDGIIRSSKYENIITMGMRGERDSVMLGANSLQSSIDMWKEIISCQDRLIDEYAKNKADHPKLIAIYKEVEDYFFGDETTKGLAGWEGLEDKLLMFCEDNYGYMRRLPDETLRGQCAGLGMYYHLDYHGAPVSYEWINSTPLYKIWEQMGEAYNHGIKDMWMVNVGDLKGNEYPLSYFMAMAYDFEKWGSSNPDSYKDYALHFANTVFNQPRVAEVLTEGIELISYRRPEALGVDIYKRTNGEVDYLIERCLKACRAVLLLKNDIQEEKRDAYFSMVEYPVIIGLNHILLFLFASKNEHYAKQGKTVANNYGELVKVCYREEEKLKKRFAEFKDGKWKGMELANHTGFTKWNEDGAKKPLRYAVEPQEKPHLLVSEIDEDRVASKNYGEPDTIVIKNFRYRGEEVAAVEVANDGKGALEVSVSSEDDNLIFSWTSKTVRDQEVLTIGFRDKNRVSDKSQVIITDGDTSVRLLIEEQKDYVILKAEDYKKFGEEKKLLELKEFGKHGSAIKFLSNNDDNTFIEYGFDCKNEATACLTICTCPTNAYDPAKTLGLGVEINGQNFGRQALISDSYKAGDSSCKEWALGVIDNERRISISFKAKAGENRIRLYGASYGTIIEKLLIHEVDGKESYLGI